MDTRYFETAFVNRLLGAIDDLDAIVDGVLFDSENSQALALMQARYQDQVNCIYIDPPYNTDASAIDYKNGYKSKLPTNSHLAGYDSRPADASKN